MEKIHAFKFNGSDTTKDTYVVVDLDVGLIDWTTGKKFKYYRLFKASTPFGKTEAISFGELRKFALKHPENKRLQEVFAEVEKFYKETD